MRFFPVAVAIALGLAGCSEPTPSNQTTSVEQTAGAYDMMASRATVAKIDMAAETAFLTEEERQVINRLNMVGDLMSEIFLRQVSVNNPAVRAEIAASERVDREALLDMFDLHFGPWDTLKEGHAFYGDAPMPAGAGFYPTDMTKQEFEDWISNHPGDEAAFRSLYTVIRREGENLIAIPYSEVYREWLEPAAELMREAAEITSNASLKHFLNIRADAFFTDDYYASEIAWMDLEGTPIEVVIGPYEVYTDALFGYKAAFEAFITIRDPEESAAVEKYIKYLRDMEANLPVDEAYKNFKRGFESPMAAVYQLHGGGDNVRGVQTIAFNLPNDERVREAKGAKKVLLNNVLGAKFEMILEPMADRILIPEQAVLLVKKYMAMETLFHELSHSLGPGTITVGEVETTVNAQFRELYSAIEEGKADVMGAYNILFMMELGELPVAEKESFLATYFVGLFRSIRFGIDEAHGRGAAFQYTYFKEKGAFSVDPDSGLFTVNFAELEAAIRDLTRDIVILQAGGDYDAAAAFLEGYAHLDEAALAALARAGDIPVDIQPTYPDEI